MSIANPIFYVVLMAAFLLIGEAIARWVPFYRRETQSDDAARFEALDGLRGWLAFGVFFHHARLTWQYYTADRAWEAPEQGLYHVLGPLSVAFFFSITAFLFWGKALAAGGKLSPLRLYENRVRRIAPMYLVSLAVVGIILLTLAKLHFPARPGHVVFRGGLSLLLGLFGLPQEMINDVPVNMANAGVYWTLQYEWAFYFALPILALALRRSWAFGVFVVVFALIAFLSPSIRMARLSPFVLGMCAAWLIASRAKLPLVRSRLASVVLLVLLCLAPFAMTTYGAQPGPSQWTVAGTLLIALPFVAIVYDNTFFGLLTLRGAKVLGLISYSVYLLHGMVLFVAMRWVNSFYPLKQMAPVQYWLIAGSTGVLTLGLSALTYRFVEFPWLSSKSKRAKVTVSAKDAAALPVGIS